MRVVAGAAVLLAGGWGLTTTLDEPVWSDAERVAVTLWEHGASGAADVPLELQQGAFAAVGDPVFSATDSQDFALVGRVTATPEGLQVRFRPGATPRSTDASLRSYRSDQSVAWVFRTLLPPDKQAEVRKLARRAFDEHREELTAALEPLVLESFRDATRAIQAQLPEVLRTHRSELQELGVAYQEELVREELLPMAQERLLPLIAERARPLLTDVGQDIWARVSLWRVGSRYVWDKLPLTSGTSLEKEWERVLEEEVVPLVQERVPDFVALTREILKDAAADPEIRSTVRDALGQVVEDPRVHRLVVSMFKQAVVDNRSLRASLKERWRSEEARAAFALTERRLQPTLVKIGEILFGVRGEGISPELAAVLRNRLLLKDRRWLVLEAGGGPGDPPSVLAVRPGREDLDPFQPRSGVGEGPR